MRSNQLTIGQRVWDDNNEKFLYIKSFSNGAETITACTENGLDSLTLAETLEDGAKEYKSIVAYIWVILEGETFMGKEVCYLVDEPDCELFCPELACDVDEDELDSCYMRTINKNLEAFEKHNIHKVNTEPLYEGYPQSVEMELYTDAGEDILIDLEKPTRDCLLQWIEDFDINDEVVKWWTSDRRDSLPFNNIKEHYEDYEAMIDKLLKLADELL